MPALSSHPAYCHTPEVCPRSPEIAAQAERLHNLERWQTAQNGSLLRLEKKVDKLKNWIMGSLGMALIGVLVELLHGK